MRRFEIAKGYEGYNVILPARKTEASAGYDFAAIEEYEVAPGENVIIKTGLKAKMENDEVLLCFIRSSLALKKHIQLSNSVAVIDADYYGNPDNDGHIMLTVTNFGKDPVHIQTGERIGQGIFMKYLVTDDDVPGGKRLGGYGSTGK